MGVNNSWRVPVTMNDWMRDIEKRLMHEERRIIPHSASDTVGRGISAYSVLVQDWNSEGPTINGYFHSVPSQVVNSPDDTRHWIGMVEANSDGKGVQRVWEYLDVATAAPVNPVQWTRSFITNDDFTRTYTAWAETVSGGGGGGSTTAPPARASMTTTQAVSPAHQTWTVRSGWTDIDPVNAPRVGITNPSGGIMVVGTTGWWQIDFMIGWAANVTGRRLGAIWIKRPGGSKIALLTDEVSPNTTNLVTTCGAGGTFWLEAGTEVTIEGWQASGAALAWSTNADYNTLTMVLLSTGVGSGAEGGMIDTAVFTADGTFIKDNYAGATGFLVQCIGGGGGGGGASATANTMGAGGGGGGYGEKFYTYAEMPASVAVTIGQGGTGGGGAANGNNGTGTVFGGMTAGGGNGGGHFTAADRGAVGGAGGIALGTFDIGIGGEGGFPGFNADAITSSGQGGAAARGGGGGRATADAGGQTTGDNGRNYGGGGSGARNGGAGNAAGGSGANGVCVVYVYGVTPAGSPQQVPSLSWTIPTSAYTSTGWVRYATGSLPIVTPGWYLVSLRLTILAGSNNTAGRRGVSVSKTTASPEGTTLQNTVQAPTNASTDMSVSGAVLCNTGDEICAWRYTDVANHYGNSSGTLTAVFISPAV